MKVLLATALALLLANAASAQYGYSANNYGYMQQNVWQPNVIVSPDFMYRGGGSGFYYSSPYTGTIQTWSPNYQWSPNLYRPYYPGGMYQQPMYQRNFRRW